MTNKIDKVARFQYLFSQPENKSEKFTMSVKNFTIYLYLKYQILKVRKFTILTTTVDDGITVTLPLRNFRCFF